MWPAHRTNVVARLRNPGHHLGSATGSDLREVFAEGDVPYPVNPVFVNPVFNVPMLTDDLQQTVRPGRGWRETGHRIAHRHLNPPFHRPPPLQPAHLLQVRPRFPRRSGAARIAI